MSFIEPFVKFVTFEKPHDIFSIVGWASSNTLRVFLFTITVQFLYIFIYLTSKGFTIWFLYITVLLNHKLSCQKDNSVERTAVL